MKAFCAVVLLSVLCLCQLALSAPDCSPNGVQDSYAKQLCSCFSGYAPSTTAQNDCNDSANCPAYDPIDTRTSVGGYPPYLYKHALKADRYNVNIRVPLVNGRRNATVRFSGGGASCGYPGNLWVKQSNRLDCVDELIGSMPWTSNSMCGFKKSSSSARVTYSAGILVSYDDTITDSDGTIIRTVAQLLNVNVSFATQTSVVYSLFDLDAGNTYVSVTISSNVVYDPNTGLATVTILTKATWPYIVDSIIMSSTPLPNTASIVTNSLFDVVTGCTNQTGTPCSQEYIMIIAPNGACNIGGQYVFNVTVGCRGPGLGSCGGLYKVGSYSVLIYSTDICGVGTVDAGLSNGMLLPYSDPAHLIDASAFLPNAKVYFLFSIRSDSVTLDDINVVYIDASTAASTDVLYNLNPVGAVTPGLTTLGKTAELSIVPAVTPISPGVAATFTFEIKLVDAVPSFRVLPSAPATVSMSVVVELKYHGVTRREVLTALAIDAASASAGSVKARTEIYISSETEITDNPAQLTAAAANVTPLATMMMMISLVIMMVLLQ